MVFRYKSKNTLKYIGYLKWFSDIKVKILYSTATIETISIMAVNSYENCYTLIYNALTSNTNVRRKKCQNVNKIKLHIDIRELHVYIYGNTKIKQFI